MTIHFWVDVELDTLRTAYISWKWYIHMERSSDDLYFPTWWLEKRRLACIPIIRSTSIPTLAFSQHVGARITTLSTNSLVDCHHVWVVLWLVLGVQVGSTELLLFEHAKAIPNCWANCKVGLPQALDTKQWIQTIQAMYIARYNPPEVSQRLQGCALVAFTHPGLTL